jgi:NSS family neurotransmitter:Na+ symporter
MDHFRAFLKPDFSKVGFAETFAAMGQGFFSVGLGANVIIGYAKFLRDEENIPTTSCLTAINDTAASVLASLFIIPVALAFGLGLASGPDLYFNTLPRIFSIMEGGRLVASILLLAFALMSFLSVIAGIQFVVTSLEERPFARNISRRKLLIGLGLAESALITVPAFYTGALGMIDLVFGSGVIIAGSFLMIVALTWSVDKSGALCRIFRHSKLTALNRMFYLWLKWIVPGFLLVILGGTLYEAFFT